MTKKDKNWVICPEDCEGCPRTRKEMKKKMLKLISKIRKCPNCNCGNPKDCCIDYTELKSQVKGIK
jgi:hypothetical protein